MKPGEGSLNQEHGSQTYTDQLERTRWGQYLTQVEDDVLTSALDLLGEPGNALEMGCSSGRWSSRLVERGWKVTCVDIEESALQICQQRIPGASCILASPNDRTIPSPDRAFKLILCIEVEAVLHSEWFLDEAHRVLVDGGCVISTMTNRSSVRALPHQVLEGLRANSQRFRPGPPSYKTSYRAWRQTLSRKGFTTVGAQGCCWFPFQRNSNSVLVRLVTQFEKALGLRRLTGFSPWIVSAAQKTL